MPLAAHALGKLGWEACVPSHGCGARAAVASGCGVSSAGFAVVFQDTDHVPARPALPSIRLFTFCLTQFGRPLYAFRRPLQTQVGESCADAPSEL